MKVKIQDFNSSTKVDKLHIGQVFRTSGYHYMVIDPSILKDDAEEEDRVFAVNLLTGHLAWFESETQVVHIADAYLGRGEGS